MKNVNQIIKKLGHFKNVSNMTSDNGNDVPNQFIINFENGSLFKSYQSIIAIEYDGKIYLTDYWDYSLTTGKYRNKFLGESIKETRQKIKKGEYILLQGY